MEKIRKARNARSLARIGFLLLLIATIYLAANILRVKSDHGINQQDGLYWQPKNSIDVVMMGTSHIHCDVNTGLLWEKYGIAAYDYSGAEQPLWMTYYYLKELYRYQTPQIVVLDLYGPARFKEDYQYEWIAENIYGMRFSLNKLKMLSVSVEPSRLHEYFPSFAVYHSRYDELDMEDFSHFFWDSQEREAFKGYTPYWEKEAQQRPEVNEGRTDGLTPKSEEYLRKIISYIQKKKGKLILIVAPHIVNEEDMRTYNRIKEIAEEEGVAYIDYNERYDEIGLDFEEDFNDDSHLNYWGSCKFTDYLGEFLDSCQELPDRRGQDGYESWEENARLIRQELADFEGGVLEQP